ncbi:hypothetical protein [Herbiconiux sp. UC225_62]|uniref:hypothetical protein n=1 Tax=Herbiconiux sp. UC225_62 TaxID=3350168 RepID=UPI0036D3B69D
MVIRVLMNPAGRNNPNSPIHALVEALDDDIRVEPFTWKKALIGRYDVLHVHWPEALVRSTRVAPRLVKSALLFAVLLMARLGLRQIIWTVHNEHPHESGGWLEGRLLRWWEKTVTCRVYLFGSVMPSTSRNRVEHIPFGNFDQILRENATAERPDPVRGSILTFGVLRPYKGIEDLIKVGQLLPAPVDITIAGRPADERYLRELETLANGTEGIQIVPRLLEYRELITLVSGTQLVVLPYKKMYNSGVALLALTLGRPILVPWSLTMQELSDEVGAGWVITYKGELKPEDITSAIDNLGANSGTSTPDLSNRQWGAVGSAYSDLYRSLKKSQKGARDD